MTTTKPTEISVGENVRYAVEGDELVIRLDLTHRASSAPLPGKKTIRVSSTLGNTPIQGTEVIVGLNAYVKP
jgi:hypothetical protein